MLSTTEILDFILTEKASKKSMLSEGWTLQRVLFFLYPIRRNALLHSCSFLLQYFLLKGKCLACRALQSYQLWEFEQASAAGSEDGSPNRTPIKCPRASLTFWTMQASHRKGIFPSMSFRCQKEISLLQETQSINRDTVQRLHRPYSHNGSLTSYLPVAGDLPFSAHLTTNTEMHLERVYLCK